MASKNILPQRDYWLDRRLLNVNHNEFAHTVNVPETIDEWHAQREYTRSQLALSAGLIPPPDFPDLEPKIWDEKPYEGVTIAKVEFYSVPGLICTGSLYLPSNIKGKIPGILCPYGHWQFGRFHDHELGSIPVRCVRFAQLGFAVFCYDMLGKCDNKHILHNPPLNIERIAELYGTTPFALQTWNSIRALDFLTELPYVDENRIGCTGASGGASQTWTITALDERIKVFAPVCMLSSHFQGGCICEEGPLLRINGLTSFDVLSACAPRPVLLPSVTQDWTNLNPNYEVQALKRIYQMLGKPKNIKNFHADAPHNYNQFTREHVYPWFIHFLMDQPLKNTVPETGLQAPPIELLKHNEGEVAPTPESSVEALTLIQNYTTKDVLGFALEKKDFNEEREERLDLLALVLNADTQVEKVAVRVTCPKWETENANVAGLLVSRRDVGDIIPTIKITPKNAPQTKNACLLLSTDGKNAFLDDEKLTPILDAVLRKKNTAFAIDCIGTGETAHMPEKSPRMENNPDFFAFNQSIFSLRVQDVLTTLAMISEAGFESVSIIAVGEAARIAACAAPLAENVKLTLLDMTDVLDSMDAWLLPGNFQPLALKLGGLKGILPLAAPGKLAIKAPQDDINELLADLYKTLDRRSAYQRIDGAFTEAIDKLL